MLQPLGPDVIKKELNLDDYIDRLGASLGIDTQGLIKSPEQKQQEAQAKQQQMQQLQMMQMAEKGVAPVAKGVMENMAQQPPQEEDNNG